MDYTSWGVTSGGVAYDACKWEVSKSSDFLVKMERAIVLVRLLLLLLHEERLALSSLLLRPRRPLTKHEIVAFN